MLLAEVREAATLAPASRSGCGGGLEDLDLGLGFGVDLGFGGALVVLVRLVEGASFSSSSSSSEGSGDSCFTAERARLRALLAGTVVVPGSDFAVFFAPDADCFFLFDSLPVGVAGASALVTDERVVRAIVIWCLRSKQGRCLDWRNKLFCLIEAVKEGSRADCRRWPVKGWRAIRGALLREAMVIKI